MDKVSDYAMAYQDSRKQPLYGPLKLWIDKTWRPGEIELVK
jgi:hypothetical protein